VVKDVSFFLTSWWHRTLSLLELFKILKKMIIDLFLGWLGDNGQWRLESVKGSKWKLARSRKEVRQAKREII